MKANAGNADKPKDIQGKPQPAPGRYHVNITACNDSRAKKDGSPLHATVFQLEVLDGNVPGQIGKEMAMFARLGENGEETDEYCGVISRLALATGILKPREAKELQPEDFEGQQFVVGWESYIDKQKKIKFSVANFGLATWGVDDADVADVPKNAQAIKLWRDAMGNHQGRETQTVSSADVGAAPELLL